MNPDRIVIGTRSKRAEEIMKALYSTFDAPIVVVDPRSAEMIKYASNAFLAVKISFINEVAGLCDLVGADVVQVARAWGLILASDKPFWSRHRLRGLLLPQGYPGAVAHRQPGGLPAPHP